MQFHHHGYVSGDPRVHEPAGVGIDRPIALPTHVDVLIVGTGPAGMITAAQLSQFPSITTRIVEQRAGRLAIGQADGIQARSVETFQAFGFASRIIAEAYRITEMAFWKPDPTDRTRIVRTTRVADDPNGVSEFPHLIVNQARVLDYFAEVAANAPTRLRPDYGMKFQSLQIGAGDYPVAVSLAHTAGPRVGETQVVHAKYVVGADGARSEVRASIGCMMLGNRAFHAWGVMDFLAVTNFPDIRTKCAIQSGDGGSILLIPREGGFLCRMYVDLGPVDEGDNGRVRATTVDQIINQANKILHPYTLDVRDVAWHSVYEVGHRVTDRFDDVPSAEVGIRAPRVFIAGDACHTHSAKAGQGMNVSMQDGFNLGWKLAHVLQGRCREDLLATYSAERQVIAQNLIDFDKKWSTMMAKRPEDFATSSELEDFYVSTAEFPAGFMTQYQQSLIIGGPIHQHLATGFPIGKRFKSAVVTRVADGNPVHLGHHHRADGRWRIYVFASRECRDGDTSPLDGLADWLAHSAHSPVTAYTPKDCDIDSVFDIKVILPQAHTAVALDKVPAIFLPRVGPFQLLDYEKVYSAVPSNDIFQERGIDDGGAMVIVRPDQYVAQIIPLTAVDDLAAFFGAFMLSQSGHSVG